LAGVKQVGSQAMYFSADIHTSVPFLCGIKLSLSAAVLFELVDTFFSVGSVLIKLKKSQLNCWGKSGGDLPLYKRWVVAKDAPCRCQNAGLLFSHDQNLICL